MQSERINRALLHAPVFAIMPWTVMLSDRDLEFFQRVGFQLTLERFLLALSRWGSSSIYPAQTQPQRSCSG